MMLFRIVAISCLVACVSCAAQVRRSPLDGQVVPQTAGASLDKAAHQAKLHYVEIGPSLKGDYKFGYDTGSGPAGQSFREETRLDDGTVKGAYGYVDANGKQRIVKYTAGKAGFVVESDAEAGQQAASGARQEPKQEPAQPLVPATLPQQAPVQPQQQPRFDEQPVPVQIERQSAALNNQLSAEQQHAQQLRQHQLAQQRALAEQQQLAQQQQLQQQQLLQQQQQQAQFAGQQRSQVAQQPQFQQPNFPTSQSAAQQFADPQTGHFFSSSNDQSINQLLANQLRQLQAPQLPPASQQQAFGAGQQFAGNRPAQAQAQPALRQPSFGPAQQPLDFSHQLRARQVAQQPQPLPLPQPGNLASPQSALLALHQQQQHDAQLLAQLRAQQLAQSQSQSQQENRFAQQPQQLLANSQVGPQVEARAAPQQQLLHQDQFAPQPQPAAQPLVQPQPHPQHQAASLAPAQAAESFGPPVIDIRTLNYSIGQQTRVN